MSSDHTSDVHVDDFVCSAATKRMKELQDSGCKVMLQEVPFVMAVTTPLMQRTLLMESSARSFFIDTSSSCDQMNTALTLVLVSTKAGAVPVGVCLHDSQTEASYTAAFSQLQALWYETSPALLIANFMTDDSRALKNALSAVWPDVRQLLCLFHVLQALWRWLCDGHNGMSKDNRKTVLQQFSQVVYTCSADTAAEKFEDLLAADDNNSRLHDHMSILWERRDEWCMAYRANVVNRGHNTNNYAEATFRIIKDIILSRLKAYNPLALLDYIVVVLEKYYGGTLLAAAFGRVRKPYLLFDKIRDRAAEIVSCPDAIQRIDDAIYSVKSCRDADVIYEVNSVVGMCTCSSGNQGGFCKHQAAVHVQYNTPFPNCPSMTTSDRKLLYRVATGSDAIPDDFFAPLRSDASAAVTAYTQHSRQSSCSDATVEMSSTCTHFDVVSGISPQNAL